MWVRRTRAGKTIRTPPLHRYGMQMEVIFKVESSAVHSSKHTSTLGRTPGYAKARVVRGSTPSTVLIYFPHSPTARAADWRSPRRSGRRRRRRRTGGLRAGDGASAQAEQAKAAGRIRDGRSSAPRPFSGFARIHPGEPTQAAAESKEGFEAPAARSSASSKLFGWFFFLRVASASSKAQVPQSSHLPLDLPHPLASSLRGMDNHSAPSASSRISALPQKSSTMSQNLTIMAPFLLFKTKMNSREHITIHITIYAI